MKVTFLGTNGWYSAGSENAICTILESKEYYVVFDAGEGFRKADQHITRDIPVYLFLSHLHLDHIYGLHIMPRMKFQDRVKIVVPESKQKELKTIFDSPFTATPRVEIIPVGTGKTENLPFSCECQKLVHQDEAFGYRINLDGKNISYCCDTAYCPQTISLAKNCDLLIHECTNKPGHKDKGWGHTNPEEAADIAQKSGAKKLVLTHFMPDFYPNQESRLKAQESAKNIFSDSVAALNDNILEF